MPRTLDDNEIEDLEPSTDPALDETATTSKTEAVADVAASSTATGEDTDDDLLNVVRDAVTESRAPQAASPAEGEEDGQTADGKTKEPDDEAYSDVPFHRHPRFQQLLRQRNTFRHGAEQFQKVQDFLDNSGLNSEEAAEGLIIMGLMKTNPIEAWKRLKPAVQNLLVAAGEVIPPDLEKMVQEGKMDRAAALEVSRSRAGMSAVQVQQSFQQQRQQRQQQTQAVQALGNAATEWETRRRRNDPNFDAKLVPLQKEIAYLHATEGRPDTPQGVNDQLERAYKAVNEQIKPASPSPTQKPKPAIKPITGGQVAGNQRPANASMLDIVRANRRAS